MLELDVDQLSLFSLAEKQLWIHAVEAARQASTRAMELSEGATNNWNDIIKGKKYDFVSSTTQASQDPSALGATPPSLQETDKETSPKRERERAPRLQKNTTTHENQGRPQKQTPKAEDATTKEYCKQGEEKGQLAPQSRVRFAGFHKNLQESTCKLGSPGRQHIKPQPFHQEGHSDNKFQAPPHGGAQPRLHVHGGDQC